MSAPANRTPLRGVIGAALTPFAPSGAVDQQQLANELESLVVHCDAISVLGAEVSEYRALSPKLRRETLVHAIDLVAGRRPVLAGVTAPSLSETEELAALAEAHGADFVQVLLPHRTWGGEPSEDELIRLVEQLVDLSPLPVVLYHNPGHGADPSLETLIEACAVPGVAAIKDSSRNVARVLRAVEEIHHAGRAAYFATLQPLLTVLLSGGAGAMAPLPAAALAAQIRDAVDTGDLRLAASLQRKAAIFPARWSRYGLAPVMKTAAAHLGLNLGAPAPPFSAVPEAEAHAIADALAGWPRLSLTTAASQPS